MSLDIQQLYIDGRRIDADSGETFATINPATVQVQATVVEHTKGSMEIKFKKKRRKGYQKTIKHKHPFTRIRIGDIVIDPSAVAAAAS